ncbi:uncharacterized protein LOC118748189 [Rhagoletis pomonella]|uniref:uncharacterized protein LOC118748189 n=1 Tax=Rhagoletis pomonella TaxID=28610 RepID=UPI00177D7B13|nr:uncharacterized protein LOC118748189 [Rhagoletis pomonella]
MEILIFSTIIAVFCAAQALPVEVSDVGVEIAKQRLVKFPDEDSTSRTDPTSNSSDTEVAKFDEAQRILQEIEKINHALGYVRKQPEQSKLPPILDSSQYLFPKPAMQPFHQQNHQTSGMNGGTILIPSIRSVPLHSQYITPYTNSKSIAFDAAPPKHHHAKKIETKYNTHILHPNQAAQPTLPEIDKQVKLRTHFLIPVRLYRLSKDEYIHMNAPEEYRMKGYKIVGDIGDFYGKAIQKNKSSTDSKSKYPAKSHLFFLPSAVALNEDSQSSEIKLKAKEQSSENSSREEKVIGIQRPYKIQTTATSSSNGGGSSANVTTQIIRKRIIPKPLREKEPSVSEMMEQIQPAATNQNTNTHTNSKPIVNNSPNQNSNIYNVPNIGTLNIPNLANVVRPVDLKNSTAGNAIKNAFQNIFKFPFRQENKPDASAATHESNQFLQMPPKPFLTTQAYQPVQPLYEVIGQPQQPPQKGSDYHWSDESSNSASEDEEDSSAEHEEKQIFGNRHNAEQTTQMEAIKQGGIIIQRLKVRKGGIAIAGPGGVATAGSGGTAIVGPGGFALTHPRSLTIAGPGAKVIAIPSSVDLKDALERTNLNDQSIPREGKIVAIGPTVYYSPATGEADYVL